VEKTITGGGVKSNATFDLTVTCPDYTDTFTLSVGQRATTENLPVGTQCTVSEGKLPTGVFVDDSYAWGAKPANQDVTIASENQNVAVTVTNTTVRATGALTVTKTLTDPDGVYAGGNFAGTWACTYNGTDSGHGPWSLAAGASTVVSSSILLGSSCVVTENPLTSKPSTDASYSWLAPALTPSLGTVILSAAHPQGAVSVANEIVRSTGSFTVTKTVSGPAAGFPAASTFPFTWACTGTDIGWAGDNGNFNLANGGFWSVPGKTIPAGAECTVTEGTNPPANTSYTWDGVAFTAVPATGSQSDRGFTFKIPAPKAGSPLVPVNVTATNTISQKFATVNVAKTVGAGYDGVLKFGITLNCGVAGSYSANILGGASANLSVPLGSNCTVSEASRVGGLVDDSYAWDTATFTPESFEVTQTATPITVAVHNPTTRVYGSLDVTKVLSGVTGVVDPAKEYQGTFKCTHPGMDPVTGSWTTTAGATATPDTRILLGSECAVDSEESLGAPSADPSYAWLAPQFSDPVTVTANGPAHLSVTNEVKRNTGSITVRKELSGVTAGVKDGEKFTINYSCSAAGVTGTMAGSLPIGVGVDTTLLNNVPFGWSCAISETAPTAGQLKDASYSWGSTTVAPSTVVLAQGNNPAKVTITNNIVRNVGSVKLAKVFTGPSGIVDATKVYSGSFSCTYNNAVIKSGNWQTTAGAAAIELATELPVTTSCTATETALGAPSQDPSYTWNAPAVTRATVVAGDPAVITVTNTLVHNTGSLTVAKNVTGSASELAGYTGGAGKNFTVNYSCTVPGQPDIAALAGSVQVANGGTETLATGIPLGWSCTVSESTPSTTLLKDNSFAWGQALINPATVTLTAGSTTSAITVANPVTRVYGSVQVKKALSGPDGAGAVDINRNYTGTWTCTYPGEAPVSGTWSAKAQAAAATVSEKVLLNSSCIITEDTLTQPVPNDPSYRWESHVPTNDTVVLGKPAQLVMTNTFVRDTGSFTVTKRVDGNGYTGGAEDKPFTVNYNCGVGFIGTMNLAKDGKDSVAGIPSGHACVLNEAKPSGHLQTAYKWLDGTWSANVTNGSITVDKAASVDVVLTNHTEKTFGHLTVAKALAGEGGVVQGTKFTINVACTDGYTGRVTVTAGQEPVSTGKVTVGSECTVTEVPVTGGLVDDSFGWATSPAPQLVTVAAENQSVPVVVTNTTQRRYGSLSVAKKLVDPDSVYAGGNFAGTWVCKYGQGDAAVTKDGKWSVQAGAPAKVVGENILLGSSCTVSENALPEHPSADSSYVWSPSYSSGGSVVLTTLNPNQGVTVTNTVTRLTGSFAVTKSLAGTGVANGVKPGTTFNFSYKCTGAGWAGANGTFTLTPGAGSWNPATTIPAGASCTVTEGDNPATSGPSYTWDRVSFAVTGSAAKPGTTGRSVSFTIPAPVAGVSQTVGINATNTINRKMGDVVVSKTIAGASQGYDGTSKFGITLSCENAASQTLTMTGVAGNNSQKVSLPLGTKCTVTEGALGTTGLKDSSFAWTGVDITNSSFTITSATTAVEVAVTNTIGRVTGSVDVTKLLSGPAEGADPAADYSGTWSCTYPGEAAKTGKWTLKKGRSTAPITGIVLNSNCSVSENAPAAPSMDPSYRWTAPTLEGTKVTKAGETAHLVVTNRLVRDTGNILVKKTVSDQVGGFTGGKNAVFAIGYECKVDGVKSPIRGSLKVANGETATLPGSIPFGWSCAITEAPAAGNLADRSFAWGTPVISASTVVLSAGQPTITVDVTNPVKRNYGSVRVEKNITGPGAGKVPTDRAFTGTLVCSYGKDTPVTKTWSATTATPATVGGILVGSKCAVTEKAPTIAPVANDPSVTWLPAVLSADVTVSAGHAATARVTNPTRQLFGDFSITKTVTGAKAGVRADARYTFNWTCTGGTFAAPLGGTVSLRAGEVWQLPSVVPVPRGSSCSVTEARAGRPGLVDASYSWEPVKFTVSGAKGTQKDDTATFTVPRDGKKVLVGANNPIKQTQGAFAVSKGSDLVSGSIVKQGQMITYTLRAVNTSKVPVHDVELVDNLESVLASASLQGNVNVNVGSAAIANEELRWKIGTLAVGQTGTLTYKVKVTSGSEGRTINNTVYAAGDVPPDSCASAVPADRTTVANTSGQGSCGTNHPVGSAPVAPVVPPAKPELPNTGATTSWFLGAASILLTGGLVLMIITRRRRENEIL